MAGDNIRFETRRRRERALELRESGETLNKIGEILGVGLERARVLCNDAIRDRAKAPEWPLPAITREAKFADLPLADFTRQLLRLTRYRTVGDLICRNRHEVMVELLFLPNWLQRHVEEINAVLNEVEPVALDWSRLESRIVKTVRWLDFDSGPLDMAADAVNTMNQPDAILILTTGGTIDKTYFDALSPYQIGDTTVARMLEVARVTRPFRSRR